MGHIQIIKAKYGRLTLFSVLTVLLLSQAETAHPLAGPETNTIRRISATTAEAEENRTHITILGDGLIAGHQTHVLASPARLVIDIPSAGGIFPTETVPADTSNLKQIRIGYNATSIRVVLDLKESGKPAFSTHADQNVLSVIIGTKHRIANDTHPSTEKAGLQSAAPGPFPLVPAQMIEKEILPAAGDGKANGDRIKKNDKKTAGINPVSIGTPEATPPIPRAGYGETPTLMDRVQPKMSQTPEEEALFLKSVETYHAGEWLETIETLNRLTQSFPKGAYGEKSAFLLAEAYGQLSRDTVSTHLEDLKSHYENAIYRYPQSIHVPRAFFAIGDLFETTGNYHEAMGYYNLVAEKKKGALLGLRALMRKASLLQTKNRKEEALALLEDIVRNYPGSPVEDEAYVEIAKILFKMNRFSKSLSILRELRNQAPDNIYRYPAIVRYLGYNHFQLGDYVKARENLFKYYNLEPEVEDNHLVLTKVADAYRDSGEPSHAAKLYRLVLDRYPETEGALISLTRLADQQEKGELRIQRNSVQVIQPIEKPVDIPRKIYEDVIESLLQKDPKNPLIQLAMLRLAVLYQKEEKYEESYNLLREMLQKYPKTDVRQETIYAINGALEPILNGMAQKKQYIKIANTYSREKDLISQLKSPNLYLITARAFARLRLTSLATESYVLADMLLEDNKKPADLLIHLGRVEIDRQQFEKASFRLSLLTGHPPSDGKISALVYRMKGEVLMAKKQYRKAATMFSSALNHGLKRTDKIEILLDKAQALMAAHEDADALKTIKEASRLVKSSLGEIYILARKTGDLFLLLGQPQLALSVYEYALGMAQKTDHQMGLRLAIADAYKALNKTKEYLAIYEQISSSDDSFWGDLADERIAAQSFDQQATSAGSGN